MADDRLDPQAPRNRQTPQPKPVGPGGGLFLWFLIFGLIALGIYALYFQSKKGRRENIRLGQFYERLDQGAIKTVEIRRNQVFGEYRNAAKDKPQEYTLAILEPEIEALSKHLALYNREHAKEAVDYNQDPGNEVLQFLLVQLLPLLLIILLLWWLLARQFRGAGGAGGVLTFGKSRAKLHTREQSNITFDHVAGIDEAKEEVQELVEFLKNPSKFRRLGGRIPRGVLLVGPPGTGKTLLAKAIAGEAEAPFFSISGSDFIEMFVGVGASRVRDLFHQAKENAPCIIFLDEIDAVGRRRAVDLHGAGAEGAQTLNAILVEMDGFETDDNIIVIAATNRPDVLDPALLRPGRFDRQIVVDLPDIRGREAILKVHARRYKLAAGVDLRQLARGTPSFSGADLEALLNEAALHATRKAKQAIDLIDLEEARDKVRWGRQRRSREMTEEDRRITAYHESGHAIVAKLHPDAEPLHKVSIIPQGLALGMTMFLPDRDRYHYQRRRMLSQMSVLLAGRVAEEAFCGDITSGAQQDLDQATDIARLMVCRWGMSDVIGPISYHEAEESFLGRDTGRLRTCSEATALKIDEEVSRLVRAAHERAQQIVGERRREVEAMAGALLKYEVLYAADVDIILAGGEIARDPANGTPPEAAPAPEKPA
jgi:cell division protease FtsH